MTGDCALVAETVATTAGGIVLEVVTGGRDYRGEKKIVHLKRKARQNTASQKYWNSVLKHEPADEDVCAWVKEVLSTLTFFSVCYPKTKNRITKNWQELWCEPVILTLECETGALSTWTTWKISEPKVGVRVGREQDTAEQDTCSWMEERVTGPTKFWVQSQHC